MSKFKLPKMQCDNGCGGCCGVVPVTNKEFEVILEYVLEKEIVPVDNGVTCPLYTDGKCSVYTVRPLLCKLFGHNEAMKCPRGYNVNVPSRKLRKMMEKQGKCEKVLHQILVAAGVRENIDHILGAVGGYIDKEEEEEDKQEANENLSNLALTVATVGQLRNAKK